MIKSYKLHDVQFVLTKDELGYQEVLNDFANTSHIHILTYSISQSREGLYRALLNCGDDTEIVIISNIPQRWSSYFGVNYAEKARKNIKIYKNKLDPSKIGKKVEVFFCFDNHAKIIMTDDKVYVGSSNYSDESANNFEAGFICYDKDFIRFLKYEIFPWIISHSSEYTVDESLLLYETALMKSITMFDELYEEFHYSFYRLNDHRGIEHWYYNTTEPILTIRLVEYASELITKYQELALKVNNIFNHPAIYNTGNHDITGDIEKLNTMSDQIIDLLSGDIEDLARYNEQRIIDDYLNQHYAYAYDENLDIYVDRAMNIAGEIFRDLSESARDSADDLLNVLNALINLSKRIFGKYKSIPKKELLIDNTN